VQRLELLLENAHTSAMRPMIAKSESSIAVAASPGFAIVFRRDPTNGNYQTILIETLGELLRAFAGSVTENEIVRFKFTVAPTVE